VRLVLVITSLSVGGAQIMLWKLLSRLSKEFAPLVISLTSGGEIAERIQSLGVRVEALGMSPTISSSLLVARLINSLKKVKPDLVQTWLYHADLVGGLAARLANVPAVAWNIRNSDFSLDGTKRSTRLVVRACAHISRSVPDRIMCCSETAKRIHMQSGYDASRFEVIPNGFDIERFRPDQEAHRTVRAELGIPATTPLIGLIARFDPQKDHKGFFDAASRLHRQRPDTHFLLAGEGVDLSNSAIQDWAHCAGVAKTSHFLGKRQDIPRLMAALDIYTSSSSYGEAFPNVVGEAMACRVPCVVTDVGDSAYIVGDTGKVVPPCHSSALATAWEHLLTMTETDRHQLGARARERVREYFELDSVTKRYERFYKEIAALGKARKFNRGTMVRP
jgi:glycosyltransferase involved in cell wall biosynthesis